MIRHLINTLRGQFRRHTLHTLISIAGLALGLASAILIGLHVGHEFSYDRQYDHSEDIYRLVFDWRMDNGEYIADCTTPAAFAYRLAEEVPAVEVATLVMAPWGFTGVVNRGESTFYEKRVFMAKPDYFQVFSHSFIEGNGESALAQPYAVVITESTKEKYFGDETALGKTLRMDDQDYVVTGVIEDVPETSHFHFDLLGNVETRFARYGIEDPKDAWGGWGYYTYLLMTPGTDMKQFWTDLLPFLEKYNEGDPIDWTQPDLWHKFQSLNSIHLESNGRWELEPNGNGDQVRLFAWVAVLVLLLACFNFLNLSTARSITRAREVGVRKCVGASSGNLVVMFLAESLLIVAVSMGLALLVVRLTLPWFNNHLGTSLSMASLGTASVLAVMASLLMVATLLSGGYPAWVLSQFRASRILKGLREGGKQGFHLRKVLVTLQFATTIVLIIVAGGFALQISYIQNRPVGIDTDNVVYASLHNNEGDSYDALRAELLASPAIVAVGTSSGIPGMRNWTVRCSKVGGDEDVLLNFMLVEYTFRDVIGLNMAAGRWYDDTSPRSQGYNPVVLSETAIRRIGLTGDPIGQRIVVDGHENEIIGVVKDFHFRSVRYKIDPFAFWDQVDPLHVFVRFKQGQEKEGLLAMHKTWAKVLPEGQLDMRSLSGVYAELYEGDRRGKLIVTLFSGFALFIALIGLIGLAAFSAEQRQHEVAVRKVLGATPGNLLTLLSKEYLLLILFASVISQPIGYALVKWWLDGFVYRAELSPWPFVIALALVIFSAVSVSILQVMSVALRNPVESLRSE